MPSGKQLRAMLRCVGLALLGACLLPLLPLEARDGVPPTPPTLLGRQIMPPGQASTLEKLMTFFENWVGPELPEWMIHSTVIRYSARQPLYDGAGLPLLGADGRPACARIAQSARIFFPPAWRLPANRRLPLVVYTHATTMLKHGVASTFGGHEWIVGAAAAAYYGMAVAMPDQPGMGLDAEHFHPFLQARALAYATLDGIPALEQVFDTDPFLRAEQVLWDGRLFLVGYSEGAYTAMAAMKELETHPEDYPPQAGYTLTGSACMAGPFDLSGLMRADIINPLRKYPHCFYLPYIILGYHAVYGALVDPREILAPALLEDRPDGNILTWTDGSLNGFAVDALIGKRLGVPVNEMVFRDLLNPQWVASQLDDPGYESSVIHWLLVENDLHRGWAPTTPILFAQSPGDEDLPYQNTLATVGYLAAEIAKTGGDPHRLLKAVRLGNSLNGLTHLEGATLALPLAFRWIYDGMPMDPPP